MIILDTSVVSELMKPSPHAGVRGWVLARSSGELFTTSITLAEILYGIERLPDGQRKELLRSTAVELFDAFSDHVLAFNAPAAPRYAGIVSSREKRGMPIDGFDAQIASICRRHQATLATRNVKDFQHTGVDVIDPWHST
jgi:predicted nucleic acid-binding protein